MKENKTIHYSDGSKCNLETTDERHTIELDVKTKQIILTLNRSPVMKEWNIASTPILYRNASSTKVIVANSHIINLEDGSVENMITTKGNPEVMTNATVNALNYTYPTIYEDEFPQNAQNATLEQLREMTPSLNESIDFTKMRILPTIEHIIKFIIPRYIPKIKLSDSDINYISTDYLIFYIKKFYASNLEYFDNNLKFNKIKNKVILQFRSFEYKNFCLSATQTPQSSKAGLIAGIPLGMEIDPETGWILSAPELPIGFATSFNPFPGRMLSNREVVQQSVLQACETQIEEEPYIIFKH